MSIHVQTALGLIEVSGSITQEKIIDALGYIPVNPEQLQNILDDESNNLKIVDPDGNIIVEINRNGVNTTEVIADGVSLKKTLTSHINDNTKHITAAERAAWNNKPDSYVELSGAPAITDDESDKFQVTDFQGNIAFQVDNNGAKAIDFRMGDISTKDHITTGTMHITNDERTRWNNATDYNKLDNAPPISADDDTSFAIVDPDGNKIFQIDGTGVRTTKVDAQQVVSDFAQVKQLNVGKGVNFTGHINSLEGIPLRGYATNDSLNDHIGNSDIHVTVEGKRVWDSISSEDSAVLNITDADGNIVACFDNSGLRVYNITINDGTGGNINLRDELAELKQMIEKLTG